ncbi:GrpE protein 1, mitochondrial [Pitangus sulphuratus]|nr:GrpE protein 1, mitochondrial [Pitangus sulphuratus]
MNMEQTPKKGISCLTYRTSTESPKQSITQVITAISISIFDSHSPVKINDYTIGAYWLSCTLMVPFPKTAEATTQQKNPGQNLEEDQSQSQNEQKAETSSAEKLLAEEKAKLEEQLKEVTDKYRRALADAENVRQRSQKLVEEAKLYGIQSFCKDLLEVADILEKATESVPKEEIKDDNPHLKSLYEGLVMTEVQIQKVFKKHGLLRLDPVGAKFDPYEHEALFHTPMEGKEPGTIALVSKIGYKLHGRTLRPALVGVVKDP